MTNSNKVLVIEGKKMPWHHFYGVGGNILSYGNGISSDLLDMKDVCLADELADRYGDKVVRKLWHNDELEKIDEILQDDHAKMFLEKYALNSTKRLLLSLIYAKKAKDKNALSGDIRFIPKQFDIEIFDSLPEECAEMFKGIKIPRLFIIKHRIRQNMGMIIASVMLKLLPYYYLLRIIFNSRSKTSLKASYKYGIYLWGTDWGFSDGPNSMDLFIKQGMMSKDEVLYVITAPPSLATPSYLKRVNASGYDHCYLEDIFRSCSVGQYLEIFNRTIKSLAGSFRSIRTSRRATKIALNKMLKDIILWEIFYAVTGVGAFIAIQEPGASTRVIWQRKYGSLNYFIYLSSTHLRGLATNIYYSRMIFDRFMSSKIPVKEFKGYGNRIAQYDDVGIVNADHVRSTRSDKGSRARIYKMLKLPGDKKIISVFDDNSDSYDIIPLNEIEYFTAGILKLIEENPDYCVLFKPRSLNVFKRADKLKSIYGKLKFHDRCRVMNTLPGKISAYEMMGISDLVITVYSSSTLTEALSGGAKTICFKPRSAGYDHFWDVIEAMHKVTCHTHEELSGHARYWLADADNKKYEEMNGGHIREHVDGYCDGKALLRLKQCLMERNK